MTLRSGHGDCAGTPRIEVAPADELPAGVPAPASPAVDRDDAGRLTPGAGTRALARKAALAKHEAARLGRLLGLHEPDEQHAYHRYFRLACDWREQHVAQLAATVAGGQVGPGPASIVATAGLQLAASRFLFDLGSQTGDAKTLLDASRLADASRQNLLAAHELAAREAAARGTGSGVPAWAGGER